MGMQKKSKDSSETRDRHTNDMINELFGEAADLGGETPDIENDVADLGLDSDEDVKIVDEEKRQKFYFGFAVFVVIMAIIGLVTCIRLAVIGIKSLVDNTSLKNELTQFILPAVAIDVSSFENEEELSNSSKINCSIWQILLSEGYEIYKNPNAESYTIPDVNVGVACKAMFGSDAEIIHQSVGYGEARFSYDSEKHVYYCPRNLRSLNYAPMITEMTDNNGVYTLVVEYLPPSISMVADNLGIELEPDKAMVYTVTRQDKKNILTSVTFPANNIE